MTVQAKDTRAAFRRHVLPLLREHGFADGTPGALWRHSGTRIDHVELKCISAYDARVLKTTTASFSVRIATSLEGFGALDDPFHKEHVKSGPNGPRPAESQMPIRGVLCAPDAPELKKGRWGWEFDWVWSVTSVEEVDQIAAQLVVGLDEYGLEWLSRNWEYEELLKVLDRSETSPMLVSKPNGSHLRLDASIPGSQVHSGHKAMLRRAIMRRK